MRRHFLIVFLSLGAAVHAQVVFVDINAPGPADGNSWATAHTSIQAGITDADVSDEQVWVANGTYTEMIAMASSVEIYGGFTGSGGLEETLLSRRDPASNETVIDAGGADHAVGFIATVDARLEGFAITGGIANGGGNDENGGGIFFSAADSTNALVNCLVAGNSAISYGGGLYIDAASPEITRCVIAANVAQRGAGVMSINDSDPTFNQCSLIGNYANDFGGGIGFAFSSGGSVTNTLIIGNGCGTSGAGIYSVMGGHPEFNCCTVSGNVPGAEGGGAWLFNSTCGFTNVLFEDNPAQAIHENDTLSDPLVSFCLFDANPDGDYWNENSTLLTGAASIETLAEASDIVDNPLSLPMFASQATGTWTEVSGRVGTCLSWRPHPCPRGDPAPVFGGSSSSGRRSISTGASRSRAI